jgi:hypothetical protein
MTQRQGSTTCANRCVFVSERKMKKSVFVTIIIVKIIEIDKELKALKKRKKERK